MTDLLGYQPFIDALPNANRIPSGVAGGVKSDNHRDMVTDLMDTARTLYRYQCFIEHEDGTYSDPLNLSNNMSPATRTTELAAYIASDLQDGDTLVLGQGLYEASELILDGDHANITVVGNRALFYRPDATDTDYVIRFGGSQGVNQRCVVHQLRCHGNRENNQSNTVNANNNVQVSGNVDFIDCDVYMTPPQASASITPRCIQVARDIARFRMFGGRIADAGYALCRSRGKYTLLDGVLLEYTDYNCPNSFRKTIAFSAASATITSVAHGLSNSDLVALKTDGSLPTEFTIIDLYYVKSVTADTFELSLTDGGTSIVPSTIGSGAHTAISIDTTLHQHRGWSSDLGDQNQFIVRNCRFADPTVGYIGVGTFTPDDNSTTWTCTFDETADTVTATGTTVSNGDLVRFVSTGTLPTTVKHRESYYVVNKSGDTFQLAQLPDEDPLPIEGEGTGTRTLIRGYVMDLACVDGLEIDAPNAIGSSSLAWMKQDLVRTTILRNITSTWSKTRGGTTGFMDLMNFDSVHPLPTGGSSKIGGVDPQVIVEGCYCPSGSFSFSGGSEVGTMHVRACTFGNMHINGYMLQNIVGRFIHFQECTLYGGDFTLIRLGDSWDFDLHELYFSRCKVIVNNDGTSAGRHVITQNLRGGFFECELQSRGQYGVYWANSANSRLELSLAAPADWKKKLYQPIALGTGGGTYSDDHPTDPTGIDAAGGMTMVGDDGSFRVYNVNTALWETK